MKETFRKIAAKVSVATGSVGAFALAVTIVIIWAVTGPFFDYSNTWQLVINTGTTIGTFLMVFLIQNTQNRDAKAMQLKLDELIRASRANDTFIDIEDLSDDELETIADSFHKIHAETSDPTYKKFKSKLEEVMTRRRTMPGEDVASQVVNILNPFDNHENHHKHKK